MVEHPAVNRRVASSSLACGALKETHPVVIPTKSGCKFDPDIVGTAKLQKIPPDHWLGVFVMLPSQEYFQNQRV